jgi:hypothetical protein
VCGDGVQDTKHDEEIRAKRMAEAKRRRDEESAEEARRLAEEKAKAEEELRR